MPNPPVRVSPTRETSTHDVSLSDEAGIIGLRFLGDVGNNVLQELPISEPARPYSFRQSSWFGGSRRLTYKDDPNGFFDSYNLWPFTEGRLFPRPAEFYAIGYRGSEQYQPSQPALDVSGNALTSGMGFVKLLAKANGNASAADMYIDQAFYNVSAFSAVRIGLWLRTTGQPGNLTISLYSDSAGAPLTLLKSATLAYTACNQYGVTFVSITAQALTATTKYHLVIKSLSTDNEANHWELLTAVDQENVGDVNSSEGKINFAGVGTAFANWGHTPYYRITDADKARAWSFFNLYGADYAVSLNDDATAPRLFINGDRGIATSGGASTLSDTSAGVGTAWTTDMWKGAKVRIIEGTGDGQAPRSIVSNTGTQLTVTPAWDVQPTTSSQYIIYDTPIWQEITGHGLSNVLSRPAVANSIAYFPQAGGTNYIRRMKVDYTQANMHNFEADGTNIAGYLETYYDPDQGLQLFNAWHASSKLFSATPAAWGTPTTFTAVTGTYVGTSDKLITGLMGRDALYVFKEDSLWKVIRGRPVQIVTGMEYSSDFNNGRSAAGGGSEIWWGWNHSLVRMISSDIRDMLNFRQGWQGLPPDRRGIPKSGVNVGAWWFFALDGGANYRSTIICWNGQGWSEIYRSPAAGDRIRNVYWVATSEGRGKLYFDVDGDMVYIEFPLYAANPQLDTSIRFAPFTEVVTTTFDGGDAMLEKALHDVVLLIANQYGGSLYNRGYIKVYYQVDDEINDDVTVDHATWHYAGEFRGAETARVFKTRDLAVDFGSVNRYRIKLEIFTSPAVAPLTLMYMETRGDIFNPLQYRWTGVFQVDSNQLTYEGDGDFTPDQVVDFLRNAHKSGKTLYMRAIVANMDSRKVIVSNAPVVTYRWVRSDNGKSTWGGYITVGLKEPG